MKLRWARGYKRHCLQGLVSREELWVTSKLWNTYHRPEHVRAACERTLQDLRLSELDLYLIHFPIALQYVDFDTRYPPEWIADPDAENPVMVPDPVPLSETWGAMEELVRAGLVKEIGVCNYNTGLLHDLMAYSQIKPAMLQIESHPYLTQERLLRAAAQYEHGGDCVLAFGRAVLSRARHGRGGRVGARASGGERGRRASRPDASSGGVALGRPAGHGGDSEDQPSGAPERESSCYLILS